ncbi:unnamed protein product [Ectocarpus fasciculatus]
MAVLDSSRHVFSMGSDTTIGYLHDNALTEMPADIFDSLDNLETL